MHETVDGMLEEFEKAGISLPLLPRTALFLSYPNLPPNPNPDRPPDPNPDPNPDPDPDPEPNPNRLTVPLPGGHLLPRLPLQLRLLPARVRLVGGIALGTVRAATHCDGAGHQSQHEGAHLRGGVNVSMSKSGTKGEAHRCEDCLAYPCRMQLMTLCNRLSALLGLTYFLVLLTTI